MQQREDDCRKATAAMGMVPPGTWGKEVVQKSLNPIQKDYDDVLKNKPLKKK